MTYPELRQTAVEYTDSVEEKKHWSDENDSNAIFTREEVEQAYIDGAEFGYNKANKWQTGEPIKGREIFARNIANCNLLATYFNGAWRNIWNGAVIDFNKITMWRYTGFKNNGEEIVLSKEMAE